ncbi:ral guanine nucleotide dissociation stimulator-like [Dasypus novemcinctus]|uniref:ral guanine nucleotide dissociation stimulator-like n=1 Tax=Dasypus novemcinctus TaxID=9361 RepID=UPI0039C9813A
MPSSSPSIQSRAMQTNHMHGYSRVLYKWQGGPCCIVHINLYEDNVKYKNILVTSQDRALAGISKALEEHSLHQDKPEDYKLVQIISDNRSTSSPMNPPWRQSWPRDTLLNKMAKCGCPAMTYTKCFSVFTTLPCE